MKNLNKNAVIIAVILLVISLAAYVWWMPLKHLIIGILKSNLTTVFIWIFIIIIAFVHYLSHNETKENLINNNGGLEKPMDYLQFVGTYGTILMSAQSLAKEVFLQWNFLEEANCKLFNDFDKICLLSCVGVLTYYSYVKIKPICLQVFIKTNEIQSTSTDSE